MTDKQAETLERIDRRLHALEQMYPGTNRVFADRDGEWSLPSLRNDIHAALSRVDKRTCRCGAVLNFDGVGERETLLCSCGAGHQRPAPSREGVTQAERVKAALAPLVNEDMDPAMREAWLSDLARAAVAALVDEVAPIPMILHCPKCGVRHIDAQDERTPGWTNRPHRSHLCHACGCIWRPADVATEGVRSITTTGKADTWKPGDPVPEYWQTMDEALARQCLPSVEADRREQKHGR